MMKKSRVVKMWSKHNVPEELWPEILSRLPVKSLLRFRCVSTSWRALIDDPNFRRLHLTRFNAYQDESHLFFSQRATCWTVECVLRCSRTLRTTARLGYLETDLRLPSSDTVRTTIALENVRGWEVSCSIDGLFMLINFLIEMMPKLMLWNPSIRKIRTLSLPPEICSELGYFDMGLGFDPLVEDYKFVRFILTRGVISIYTIGTNSWKMIDFQCEGSSSWHQDVSFLGQRTFCLRGVLYALAGKHGCRPLNLVSFNLNNEMFASTRLPLVDDESATGTLTMVDDGSSLAVVNLLKNRGSIWVLQSSGDDLKSLSWTLRCSFAMTMPQYNAAFARTKFVYLKKNGEMLFNCNRMLTSYNLETHEENILLKKILLWGETLPYIESLIFL